MKTYLKAGIAALALGAVVATGALAHERGEGGEGMRGKGPRIDFSQLDTNGDGKITAEELTARAAARFAEADANGDGKLSADEMLAAREGRSEERRKARAERMIERLDTDGDGMLSAAELAARPGPERMIERLDTDGDGAVSEAEFAKLKERHGGKRAKRGED